MSSVSLEEAADFRHILETHKLVKEGGPEGLYVGSVSLAHLAEKYKTPLWVYDAAYIRARILKLQRAFADLHSEVGIHYAVKANDHLAVLRIFQQYGCGADVVSGGEIMKALKAGIAAEKIIFSGVGKTKDELRLALKSGIGQINAESIEELYQISAVSQELGVVAPVVLRANPNVDAGTHAKITTGLSENKFGIAASQITEACRTGALLPGVKILGLAVHIGSQITEIEPFQKGLDVLVGLIGKLRGEGFKIERADCGGGLGISYTGEPVLVPEAYAALIVNKLKGLKVRIMVEPGRWLIGPAGLLLCTVNLVKQGPLRRFIVLDAAMNDLIRPGLYEAWHAILPVAKERLRAPLSPADIVGPVCETGDSFAVARPMPPLKENDKMVILDAGAYGASMSSTYNSRPLAAAVMVDGQKETLIRRRQTIEDMLSPETDPEAG